MPVPKFIFVRHGEAKHNVDFRTNGQRAFLDLDNKDAPLTETGLQQAKVTAKALEPYASKVVDIWASPLTRTIQTAEEILEETSTWNIYLHDSLLERQGGGHICNDRKKLSELKDKFPGLETMFLPEYPPLWIERENETSLQRRMLSFVLLLAQIYKDVSEDSYIILVGHADAIFSLTKKSLKNAEFVILTLDELLNTKKNEIATTPFSQPTQPT
jgi:broad specificity phosphatase PhoE